MSQEAFIKIQKLLGEIAAGDITKYNDLAATIKSLSYKDFNKQCPFTTYKDAKSSETKVVKKSIVECILDEFLKAIDSSTIVAKLFLDAMVLVNEKGGDTLTAKNEQEKSLMAIVRDKATTTAAALWVQALENNLYSESYQATARSKLNDAQNATINALVCSIATTNDYAKFKGIVIFPTIFQLKNAGVLQKALDLIRSKPLTKAAREAKFKEFLGNLARETPKIWTINEFEMVAIAVGLKKPIVGEKAAARGAPDAKSDGARADAVGALYASPVGITPADVVAKAPAAAAVTDVGSTGPATPQPMPSSTQTATPPGP